jgi:molybdate/tungstate transport system permease protein
MMLIFGFLGAILFLFIILPVINTCLRVSPGALVETAMDTEVQGAIFMSLFSATITTCIALAFGVPLAYVLARTEFFGKSFVDAAIDIPILLPHTVAGIALLSLFGPYAPVTDSLLGIVAAQLFVSAPFLIRASRESFELIDPSLERAARTLGATQFSAFMKVTLPLAYRGILTGCILAWARAISEFGAVIILSYYPFTAPVLIWKKFVGEGLNAARPVAVLLIFITFLAFVFLRFLRSRPVKIFVRT